MEVESALRSLPNVTSAAVKVFTRRGETELCGYVVLNAKWQSVDVSTVLRTLMAADFPPALVPAEIVTMETLPLNHLGKIDRNALPSP